MLAGSFIHGGTQNELRKNPSRCQYLTSLRQKKHAKNMVVIYMLLQKIQFPILHDSATKTVVKTARLTKTMSLSEARM